MDTHTLLVGALPGRAADLTSTPPTATTGRSAPRRSIGKLHFGNHLHQVRARGKLPRSTPPHLAAAFLLPQPHSHITAGRCTSSTRCHRAAAAGLSIFNLSWVLKGLSEIVPTFENRFRAGVPLRRL